ncbi:MAG: twin-arginine translocation signal domain-containing protein, partial [Chloroflexi bacterium]|nr:twin-arginine translocation signal domain-containing protein [Chloroflexota bacterium]
MRNPNRLASAPPDPSQRQALAPALLSRRRFLKAGAGLALIGAAAAAAAQPVLGQAPQPAGGSAPGAGAVRSKRLRRWAMAIDLRRCDGCQSIDKPPQCT